MNRNKVRSDLALSFLAQFVFKILGYVVLALLARELTKNDLGAFLFAVSVSEILVMFTEFGTSNHLVRSLGADPDSAPRRLADVLTTRLSLLAFYFAAMLLFAGIFKRDLVAVLLLSALWVAMKDLHRSAASALIGVGRVRASVLVYGAGMTILVVVLLAIRAATGGLDLGQVLGSYVLWTAALLALGQTVVRRVLGPLQGRWSRDVMRSVLTSSLPLFALTALTLLHFKVDTVMLGFLRPYDEVATYEAGAKLFEASQFLVRPMWQIFLPICAAMVARREWSRLQGLMTRMTLGSAGLGVAIAVIVYLSAGWIIPQVFGEGFGGSVEILRVLYFSAPVLFVGSVAEFVAISLHQEGKALRVLAAGVAVNVGLNAVLIPIGGALAAAWATFVSQTLVTMALWHLSWAAVRTSIAEAAIAD